MLITSLSPRSPLNIIDIPVTMASKLEIPDGDILSVFLAPNGVSEDQPIWIDGQDQKQQISKSLARKLIRCLIDGYLSTGLINPQAAKPSVIILYSENQVLLFPNIFSIIGAGGTVATCPWEASVQELLYRVNSLQPVAVLCSRSSLGRVLEAAERSTKKFQIIIQDSITMDVWLQESHHSLISPHGRDWDVKWDETVANRPSVIVFSSGTTGYPKGT